MHQNKYRVLTINPGSTFTKIAMFENEISIWEKNIKHDIEITDSYTQIIEQLELEKKKFLSLYIMMGLIFQDLMLFQQEVDCLDRYKVELI